MFTTGLQMWDRYRTGGAPPAPETSFFVDFDTVTLAQANTAGVTFEGTFALEGVTDPPSPNGGNCMYAQDTQANIYINTSLLNCRGLTMQVGSSSLYRVYVSCQVGGRNYEAAPAGSLAWSTLVVTDAELTSSGATGFIKGIRIENGFNCYVDAIQLTAA